MLKKKQVLALVGIACVWAVSLSVVYVAASPAWSIDDMVSYTENMHAWRYDNGTTEMSGRSDDVVYIQTAGYKEITIHIHSDIFSGTIDLLWNCGACACGYWRGFEFDRIWYDDLSNSHFSQTYKVQGSTLIIDGTSLSTETERVGVVLVHLGWYLTT